MNVNLADFVISKLMRLPIAYLFNKPDLNAIHFVDINPNEVPGYVHKFMGKSFKFIPQPRPMRLGTVANNVADCVRALSWQLKLGNSCTRHELPTLGSNIKAWPSPYTS